MNRKKLLTLLVIGFVFFLMLGGAGVLSNWAKSLAAGSENEEADDPDMPAKFHGEIDEATYLRLRNEYIGMRRGIGRAPHAMRRERRLARARRPRPAVVAGRGRDQS